MADIGTPAGTIEIIQKYQFHFQKRFGQNFLIDSHVLDKIVHAQVLEKDTLVIEVGPGIGTLTDCLAAWAGYVVAIEIDKNLLQILDETLSKHGNISIINADILKVDLNALIVEYKEKYPQLTRVCMVANLPYYITTPIIMGIFEKEVSIDSMTVMIQKEVAERMQEGPGSKEYGALSLAVQFYAKPYLVAHVPPHCFMPRPSVSSSVIHLERHILPPVKVVDKEKMFAIIRAGFNQRRKTLVNALGNASELGFSKESIVKALDIMGLSERIRAEVLDLGQFARLTDILSREKM